MPGGKEAIVASRLQDIILLRKLNLANHHVMQMVAYPSLGDSGVRISLADYSMPLSYPDSSKLLEVSANDMGRSSAHSVAWLLCPGDTLTGAFMVPGTRIVWVDIFTKDEEHRFCLLDLDAMSAISTLEFTEQEWPELVPGAHPGQVSIGGFGTSLSAFFADGTLSMEIEPTAGRDIMRAVADPAGPGFVLARRQRGSLSGIDLAIVDSKGKLTSSTPILAEAGYLKLLTFPDDNRVGLVTSEGGGSSNECRKVVMHSYERVGGELRLDVERELPGAGYVIQDSAATAAAFVHERKHGNVMVTPIDPKLGLLKQPWKKAPGLAPSLEMQDLSGWD